MTPFVFNASLDIPDEIPERVGLRFAWIRTNPEDIMGENTVLSTPSSFYRYFEIFRAKFYQIPSTAAVEPKMQFHGRGSKD